jgi:hypothetical protein
MFRMTAPKPPRFDVFPAAAAGWTTSVVTTAATTAMLMMRFVAWFVSVTTSNSVIQPGGKPI